MDRELEEDLKEVVVKIKEWSKEDVDATLKDPMSKMMLAAIMYETRIIKDHLDLLPTRIADRFCEDFIPNAKMSAIPAIAILEPDFKKKSEGVIVDETARFAYKPSAGKPLNYIPVFKNYAIPVNEIYLMTSDSFHSPEGVRAVQLPKEQKNILWIGLCTSVEIECLKGFSLLFKGTQGIAPTRVLVGDTGRELSFATMNRMEDIEMVEPFDSQQASGCLFSFVKEWKEALLGMRDVSLAYLTDSVKDRDLFKPQHHPAIFQFCLMSEELDAIKDGTVWLKVEFPKDYHVPSDCQVIVNAFPVANVDVDYVLLTSTNPIAKLQKQDDAFFLNVINNSNRFRKEGFNIEEDEYFVRNFDASCYHDGDLYREVRNLYHHFVEDYYAFLEFHGIKDGETINQLRESFNKIGKSVGAKSAKYQFDSGVYALRNINRNPQPISTKVSYMTTRGKMGNLPREKDTMENRKCPGFGKEMQVVVSACCGRDKMSVDERYEQLRYFALTQDRLYTKMDIDAFLRKEIMSEFGSEEFKRIFVRIRIDGVGGSSGLRRGLYIDIEFKDKKNYERAVAISFANRMQQQITNKSCISMPIIVGLINLEI